MRWLILGVLLIASVAEATDVCITIPNAFVNDALDAFAERFNRPLQVMATLAPGATPNPAATPIPNPESKADFAKRQLMEWAVEIVADYRGLASSENAKRYREAVIRAQLNGLPTPTTVPTP